jgi:sugar transferase EpsL
VKLLQRLCKRLLDLTIALIGLVFLSPIFVVIAAAIALTMGRPIVFRQQRPGLKGKPYTMCKFRTMHDAFDRNGQPLPDEERSTPLGRLLRSTSLDELPELLSVVKGEMSLVGPRPLLMEYLSRYTHEQFRRHEVPPGITGWAQVNGRNVLNWEEKFRLDIWYVQNWSLALDLKILWMTVGKVLKREGISAIGHETAPAFMGSGPKQVHKPTLSDKPE